MVVPDPELARPQPRQPRLTTQDLCATTFTAAWLADNRLPSLTSDERPPPILQRPIHNAPQRAVGDAGQVPGLHPARPRPSAHLGVYNQAPGAVDRAIKAGGVADAFALINEGLLNPYAAQVVAAALVMDDPDLME